MVRAARRAARAWVFAHVGVVVAVGWPGLAAGHGGDIEARPLDPEARASEGQAGGESGESGEGAERRFKVGVDFALGWGKVPFAVQNLPTTGTQAITYTRSADTPSRVESFLLGASWEPREGLEFGARIPLSSGTFSPDGGPSRSASAIGNVELEGEVASHLGESVELAAAVGVALPTGQGDEIPDDLAGAPASSVNPDSYDRFSVARAAALARGYEDNALFEPQRLGIVPKIALAYRAGALSVEAYVKVENLVATSSALDAGYVGELVAGLKVAYHVTRPFEVALRGWVNEGFAGADQDKTTSGALQPEVVFASGGVRTYAGFMIPVAGPPSDAGFLALRLGASVAF
jgi:hypothetical protein